MRETTSSRRVRTLLAVAAVTATFAACGGDDDSSAATTAVATTAEAPAGEMSISGAWSRQPAQGQTTSAVYGVVANGTDHDVTITSATTSVAAMAQLHETIENADGTMSMQEKAGGFVVPAGGTLEFKPGGNHIMLMDVDPATYPGSIEVTLGFDGADPLTFTAEVRAIDGGDGMSGMGDDASGDDSSEVGMSMADDTHGASDAMSGEEHVDVVQELHELDDALNAGTLDATAQREVVAAAIVHAEEAGADGTELLDVLHQLDDALAAGDVTTAATLATQAHDLADEMEEHG